MSTEAAKSVKNDPKKKTQKQKPGEDIFAGFQMLRQEQRHLASKLSEFEMDLTEHKMVIDTLKNVDGDRKCFRMIGGVLCEKTVKEILPVLENSKEQLIVLVDAMNEQLTKKGVEINEYKEKHNIRIRGQDDVKETTTDSENKSSTESRGNVLVANP